MRLTTSLLAVAAITLAGATASQAMPLVSSDPVKGGAPIEQVVWRCGPAWHLNSWGRCVPNRFWRPYRRYW